MMTNKQVADIRDALKRCGSDRPDCDSCPYRTNCAQMFADALSLIAEKTEEASRLYERYKALAGAMVYARWVEINNDFSMCTSCSFMLSSSARRALGGNYNYCPRCGACMTASKGGMGRGDRDE